MNAASASLIHEMRPKILEKRARLEAAAHAVSAEYLNQLLVEVDSALARIDNGSYGICEFCHDTIEADCLAENPLVRFCLDHLDAEQRRAHEQDLALATRIQTSLLPARDISAGGWSTHYRYQPAGLVGGDYCEVIPAPDGRSLFFALGDVSGKGVAASLLMTHLSAIFRSLLSLNLPLSEVVVRANRLFCGGTPATHYATLVAGLADESGIHLCNAGHCPPLLVGRDGTCRVDSTGLPLGLFGDSRYTIGHMLLERGESLVLYSDGITEAQDPEGNSYDEERLIETLREGREREAAAMAEAALRDVVRFRCALPQHDDVTLLIVRRNA
ncbi:MAG TPA: PP2C family protein-serine/threonine phosphatase [Bryobacteraceae bacterium]|nr:PP2C family protein-serine/threonine phosphatase [Bryobacteraceae bacterium]